MLLFLIHNFMEVGQGQHGLRKKRLKCQNVTCCTNFSLHRFPDAALLFKL